jgi:hypothetical protein
MEPDQDRAQDGPTSRLEPGQGRAQDVPTRKLEPDQDRAEDRPTSRLEPDQGRVGTAAVWATMLLATLSPSSHMAWSLGPMNWIPAYSTTLCQVQGEESFLRAAYIWFQKHPLSNTILKIYLVFTYLADLFQLFVYPLTHY